jgi:uncharacterized protein YhaN
LTVASICCRKKNLMYLREIEAVRYGELSGLALGDFSPGLNIVVGRNEAGKSSLTSLVRHVLFGFPRGRTSERLYQPVSGDQRVGRLVFADEVSEWVVERTEGVHGGNAVVHGPQGENPGEEFLEPLISSVSATVYRTVFGFSLEELSDLSSLADIQSRLYATTAGLGVNPHDVLGRLRAEADELWAPRARTRKIHVLNKELRSLRDERRQLQEAADRYRTDREHRSVVAREVEAADMALEAARAEEENKAALLAEARRLEERIRGDEEAAENHRLAAEAARRKAEDLEVDEALLNRAEAIERLGARCELFRAEAEQLQRDEERLKEIEADLRRRVADMGEGWTVDTPTAFKIDLDLENRLAEEEERMREARTERDRAVRKAAEARAEHEEALRAAKEGAVGLDLGDDELVADVIGVRLQTVDRLLALGSISRSHEASLIPAISALLITVALVAAGVMLDDRLLIYAGALPAVLAIGLFLRPVLVRHRVPREIGSLLPVLGLDQPPTAPELMEVRNSLETCRRLWTSERQLGRVAAARDNGAREATEAFDAAWKNWLEWLDKYGLRTPTNHPESVRRVLRLLRDLRSRIDGRGELETQIARRRSAAKEFVDDAVAIGAISEGEAKTASFEEVAHGVRSLLSRLVSMRRVGDEKRDAEAQIIAAEERAASESRRAAETKKALDQLLSKSGVGGDAQLVDLEGALGIARRQAREIESERSELLETRGTLDGRMQRGAEESASARLRLAESGINERIGQHLEEFAVASIAARLLEDALEAYEAERQPSVIQSAQDIFTRLTGGRYTRLATPLGRFEPLVSGATSSGKPPERLSRATAEQLFLALRLSYVENLAGAHPALPVLMDDVLVNFDDERRWAAARVVGEFASTRQVVYFTCHPAMAEMFSEAADELTRLDMD